MLPLSTTEIDRVDKKNMNDLKHQSLTLQRTEIVTKEYDNQNRIVREQWQYFYPEEALEQIVGFCSKSSKRKKI